jgi:hypothetical protein
MDEYGLVRMHTADLIQAGEQARLAGEARRASRAGNGPRVGVVGRLLRATARLWSGSAGAVDAVPGRRDAAAARRSAVAEVRRTS